MGVRGRVSSRSGRFSPCEMGPDTDWVGGRCRVYVVVCVVERKQELKFRVKREARLW